MKNIDKNEKVNRTDHVISARYLIFFLILIFSLSAHVAFADSDKKTETQSTWKEIKLVLDAIDYAWCGNRHIVFSGDRKDMGKGIRIYDLDSGVIEDITNDPGHENVSCAADGRYVVFTDKTFRKKQVGLFVFDRNTKTVKKMYEMGSLPLSRIDSMPLSPNANYMLGPDLSQGQKYILPGGKEVKLVPHRTRTLDVEKFDKLQWSVDEKKLFLLDVNSESLATYDVEKDRLATSFIRIDGSSNPIDMRITKDSKLYVTALFGLEIDEDGFNNLYLFDLEKLHEQPVLVVRNINYFDADDEGNVVYSKRIKDIQGASYLEKGLYYLERGKKQTQLLKKFNVIRNAVIRPKISRNGKGIIFSLRKTNEPREFIILIKN
ncbi:MAG: hypothetical protein WC364_14130 [Eubacteriales bacterium]|jgi:hypothetical protein